MKEADSTLQGRLAALVSAMNYEFVGCELLRQGKHSVLRIFIDKTGGVTLDDCTRVSHQVSAMLDVEDPIQGQYSLEVSSPGLDRPLFEMAHYARFQGKQVKIRLRVPQDERRNFVGVILRAENDQVHLLVDAEEIILPFSNIEKGHIIADIR